MRPVTIAEIWIETPLYSCPRIPQQDEPSTPVARQEEPTARALEHAEYLAKGAEALLESVNAYFAEDGDEQAKQEAMTDHMRGLRCDIYEFRKRRDKVAAPAAVAREPQTDAQPADKRDAEHDYYSQERRLIGSSDTDK